jgi:hypothetical protein
MTAPVFQLPRPATLTRQEAEEWIRAVMLGSGFGWTDHFSKKMEDRDIPMRLVLEVLKTGCVFADPKWNAEHSDWVCKVRKTVAGRRVTVVVGLETDNKMTGVTTYG